MWSIWYVAISILIFLAFVEQILYLKKKGPIPGPFLVLPFLGTAIALVTQPTRFWEVQADFAKSSPLGISANYFFGKFVVFIRDSDISHRVFANVRPDAFHLVGHPFGKKLFGEHNLIYMFGQEHKDLRRRFAPNFTPKALSTYTEIQQGIIRRHLVMWRDMAEVKKGEAIALRLLCREMNLETSQTVFVGPYLSDESKERFRYDYNLFNVGVMSLPIDFPGCAFREARFGVQRLVNTLATCAEESMKRMRAGHEPTCLMDFYTQEVASEIDAAAEAGDPPPANVSCAAIGGHMFDFLFAAQDASTSSLLWAVTLLDSHPDVLEKVRVEVARIWSPASGVPITAEQLRELRYVEAVAREVLRIKAPATLVPHVAGTDFQLTEGYKVPKGTIVFPSVYESSFQGFVEPDQFDPDRFMEERQEDRIYKKNFLVFGAGAHQCVGQRYAVNHLVLFIAMFASMVDFKRQRTDRCDEIVYMPTICPKDDCKVFLYERNARS